jgi:DNA-binding MarR family transcriptional regulator
MLADRRAEAGMRPATGDSVVDALLAAGHAVRVATDAALRADGLSLARKKALAVLSRSAEPVALRQVSDALGIVPRSVTDLVDGLEADGLVRREQDPQDRRRASVAITDEGRAALAAAQRRSAAIARRFTADLDAAERGELLRLLERLGLPD